MGLRSIVGSAMHAMADVIEPKRDAFDPRFWADIGNMSDAGVPVTERNASQLGAVQAVRFGLSGAMSSLPIMVFKRGENGAREEQPEHPLAELLGQRPNSRNTPAEFIGEIAWHLSYWRNAYCVIHPGDEYAIGELEIIHPRRKVNVERRSDGRIYYTFNRVAANGDLVGGTDTYRDDQVWHLRGNPLEENGLCGEGIWESAREVFGRAIAVHKYGNLWFKNSGQTGGFYEHPGTFKDKSDEQEFLEAARKNSTGENRHRDRLLKYGIKYNPLKVTNAEAQLLETEERSDVDIFGLWSFPPSRAARRDISPRANREQESLDFVVYCLLPLAIAIEQAAERDLLLDNEKENSEYFVEFDFSELLRGDLATTYRAILLGRQAEVLSANDGRRILRMNPRTDSGGDSYENPITKDPGAAGQGETPPSTPPKGE